MIIWLLRDNRSEQEKEEAGRARIEVLESPWFYGLLVLTLLGSYAFNGALYGWWPF